MSERKETLCWNCKNACGGCSWSMSFVPVKGWDALPRKMKLHNPTGADGEADSYIVISCPEFVNDRAEKKPDGRSTENICGKKNARIFYCEKCGYGFDDIYLKDESNYTIEPKYCPNCGRKVKQ